MKFNDVIISAYFISITFPESFQTPGNPSRGTCQSGTWNFGIPFFGIPSSNKYYALFFSF